MNCTSQNLRRVRPKNVISIRSDGSHGLSPFPSLSPLFHFFRDEPLRYFEGPRQPTPYTDFLWVFVEVLALSGNQDPGGDSRHRHHRREVMGDRAERARVDFFCVHPKDALITNPRKFAHAIHAKSCLNLQRQKWLEGKPSSGTQFAS